MKDTLDLPDPFGVAVRQATGVDALSLYAETFWLPTIGPTSYLLARRLLHDPEEWAKADLSAALGIGFRGGKNCPLERSLSRLEGYRLASERDGILSLRAQWPRLSAKMLDKLPLWLQAQEPAMAAIAAAPAA